jgi:dethiobiotin synthetase
MTKTYFVTGTDTDVGKTVCVSALLQSFKKQGITTLAYKPIAAGCELTDDGLRNSDALALLKYSSEKVCYDEVNPITFEAPIAPHIAAEIEKKPIDLNRISKGLLNLQKKKTDILIVEGAGGWRLPINNKDYLSDWVQEQKLPVILVVGMKLGCLNHAILTYETILADGLHVMGWIANAVDKNMPYYQENLSFLKQKISAPMIAEIPYLKEIETRDLSEYVFISS